jgi:cyclopropane fatty-acyl-phospholipid synthase-like methyltransferase
MTGNQAHSKLDGYWDRAGEQGYGQAMYRSSDVEAHVRGRLWHIAVDIAGALGVPEDGHVLDLGCGDGAFANQMLAGRYAVVDGIDKSEAAIKRANAESRGLVNYRAVDLVTLDYDTLPRYDAAFLIGILHHVKQATPDIVRALALRTDKMIVLEPNGSHLLRKVMEYAPSYRAAGEDGFRSKDLMAIFAVAGWRTEIWRRLNIFPNFTPGSIYRWLRPLETRIEDSRLLKALCTVDMYGLTLAR